MRESKGKTWLRTVAATPFLLAGLASFAVGIVCLVGVEQARELWGLGRGEQ